MSGETTFWARRRAAVLAEEAAGRAALAAEAEARVQAEQAEKTDAEILEELGLPDPETLAAGDDFSAYMAKAVPHRIRSLALRKLWRSNPVLACLDGLNDYDDDYLTGSFGNAPIKTGYQVGKGMLSHLLELEKRAAGAAVDAPAEAAPETAEPEIALADEAEAEEACEVAEVAPGPSPEEDAPRPAPRRMQFRFEEDLA